MSKNKKNTTTKIYNNVCVYLGGYVITDRVMSSYKQKQLTNYEHLLLVQLVCQIMKKKKKQTIHETIVYSLSRC